jgi:hypothetical protein
MKLKKIWHHYLKWEDFQNGMYRTINGQERKEYLDRAIKFTGDHELYGASMLEVVKHWPVSCEQNLSSITMNRQAWIGHAGCCLAIGCPDDITREAWGNLTQEQQDLANAKADEAIALWEVEYARKNLKIS